MPRRNGRVLLLALAAATAASVALAGQAGLRAYFSSDFTDTAYQKRAVDRVAGSWKVPAEKPEEGSKAVVLTTIMKDGRITGITLHHKSGSEAWDRAAVGTLEGIESFEPLPKDFPRPMVEAHFHFEWNP